VFSFHIKVFAVWSAQLTGCTGLNGHVVSAQPSRSKEAEAIRDTSRPSLQGRRARSAERYEGLRVNGSKSTDNVM
jgi:hypothetical protein